MYFLKYMLLFCCIFCIVGCAAGPRRSIQVAREMDLYEQKETLVMLDNAVRRDLHVVDQSPSWTKDGRITARAQFLNKRNETLRVQIQTIFKDEDGYKVDSTNWELILIPKNAYHYYQKSSLNQKASRYTIRCKLAE